MDYYVTLLFICPMIFLSGFVDSIAGGGGLISLTSYLFTGMPVHNALGCNKFSASVGTTFSAARYFKNGALDIKVALLSAAGAFVGSAIAAKIALHLDDKVLKTALLIILPIAAAIIVFNKNKGETSSSVSLEKNFKIISALLIGFFIGAYDGIFGPGTGTFAIIAYTMIMKYDMKTASGNAKLLNLASNYAAAVTFALAGTIIYNIAIPAALFGIAGNYIGSGLAIKKGSKLIRPMLLIVLLLIFAKITAELFF